MNKKTIVIGIVVLVILIMGIWFYNSKNNAKQKVTQPINEENQNNNTEEGLVWYEVPELGIRFKANTEMKDELVYHYKGESTPSNLNGNPVGNVKTISFSVNKLVSIDKINCSAEKGPIGSVSKWDGYIESYDALKNRDLGVRQFGDFVISYSGSQAVCLIGDDVNDKLKMNTLESEVKKYSNYFRSDEFFQSIEIIK